MIKLILKETILAKGLSSALRTAITQELTWDNPEYTSRLKRGGYIPQDMPRYIYLYAILGEALYLPRGYMHTLQQKLAMEEYEIIDRTIAPEIENDFRFTSTLRDYQELATEDMLSKRYGLLEAGTGSGKTACGIYVTSVRKVKTLVIVHNKELLDQWKEAFKKHTNIKATGTIGGSAFDIQDVTIGIINSVSNKIEQLMGVFGQVIYDEAHRLPGATWVSVVNSLNCRFSVALSATPFRRDGLTEAIFALAGPRVHKVNKKHLETTGAILVPDVLRCNTRFSFDFRSDYSSMLSELTKSKARNIGIAGIIAQDFKAYGEQVMIVSDRVSHCNLLFDAVNGVDGIRAVVLSSKISKAEREEAVEGMVSGKYNALIATTSLLSEGFDLPGLSSLFITTPIRFAGKLIQLAGRILRPSDSTVKPRIYDFRDVNVPVLARSGYARDREYRKLGWTK